ncbi:hypothetical protein AWZ03_015409, partial [Drosophila navojoa]
MQFLQKEVSLSRTCHQRRRDTHGSRKGRGDPPFSGTLDHQGVTAVSGNGVVVQAICSELRVDGGTNDEKGQKWEWNEEQEEALKELKESLTTAPVLACPDFSARFVLQTDASDYGLGAMLTQVVEGEEKTDASDYGLGAMLTQVVEGEEK